MRLQAWIGVALLTLLAAGWACAEEPPCAESRPASSPWRLGPTGGWFPYGGGLLRWWPRDCFPRCGGPDDYCRKPLPSVCSPPYPSYYIWGPPEIVHPSDSCPPANEKPH
jgi:hypothetical protein